MMRKDMVLAIVASLLVGLLIGTSVMPVKEVTKDVVKEAPNLPSFTVGINVPAVDNEGRGIATKLTVESKPGTGRILTNIDKLVFWVDTQSSIRTAMLVAENYTGVETDALDIIYTIKSDNATVVGGPSAGAALTLATIAALEEKQLNGSVMITGTINNDGSIGVVGGVMEKAKAAKGIGATLFLVPVGEGTENTMKPVEKCVQKPDFIYCETRYETTHVSIGENVGIEVKEVATISDAAKYFL